jgi:hypothetical protein
LTHIDGAAAFDLLLLLVVVLAQVMAHVVFSNCRRFNSAWLSAAAVAVQIGAKLIATGFKVSTSATRMASPWNFYQKTMPLPHRCSVCHSVKQAEVVTQHMRG